MISSSATALLRTAAAAELSDYVRRTLAKGFGRQLSDEDLEDLSQDSMVRIHDKLDTFAGKSTFKTWAASIAVNTALMALRRRKYQHVTLEAAVADGKAVLDQARGPSRIQRAELHRELAEAITTALTPRQREALEAELGADNHELSPVFFQGHKLIAYIRAADEHRRGASVGQ